MICIVCVASQLEVEHFFCSRVITLLCEVNRELFNIIPVGQFQHI